jgi:hypothetical protein
MSTRPARLVGPVAWHRLALPLTSPVFWTSTDNAVASAHTLPTPIISLVFGGNAHGDLHLNRAEPARPIAKLQPAKPLSATPEPVDDPVDLSVDPAAHLSGDHSVDPAAQPPIDAAADHSIEQPADQPAEPPIDTPPDHPVDHSMDHAVDRPVDDHPTDPAVERPIDASADRPVGRSPPPRHPNGIELTIDSLPNHLLVEPIPVEIEPVGDGAYTASVHSLNTSASGHSIVEALLLLKERVEAVYDGLNSREELTADERLTLQMMHTYIAAKKPEWV